VDDDDDGDPPCTAQTAIQNPVNENGQLKFNMLLHRQPMKLPQNGSDVVMPSSTNTVAFSTAFGH